MGKGPEHHILFTKRAHNLTEDLQKVRSIRWLKPPLHRDVHDALHQEVQLVPILGHRAAGLVRRNYEPMPGDYIQSAYMYCWSVEEAVARYPSSSIEFKLGELVVYAVEQQIPFIKEGLIE